MKTKSIAFHMTAHVNEPGYLDQLYALKAVACMNIKQIPILTRRERLNYDANCRYHKVPNVFLAPSYHEGGINDLHLL